MATHFRVVTLGLRSAEPKNPRLVNQAQRKVKRKLIAGNFWNLTYCKELLFVVFGKNFKFKIFLWEWKIAVMRKKRLVASLYHPRMGSFLHFDRYKWIKVTGSFYCSVSSYNLFFTKPTLCVDRLFQHFNGDWRMVVIGTTRTFLKNACRASYLRAVSVVRGLYQCDINSHKL